LRFVSLRLMMSHRGATQAAIRLTSR
jgi:hypothetical protein